MPGRRPVLVSIYVLAPLRANFSSCSPRKVERVRIRLNACFLLLGQVLHRTAAVCEAGLAPCLALAGVVFGTSGAGGVGRVALLRGAEEHQATQEELCRSTVMKRTSDS